MQVVRVLIGGHLDFGRKTNKNQVEFAKSDGEREYPKIVRAASQLISHTLMQTCP